MDLVHQKVVNAIHRFQHKYTNRVFDNQAEKRQTGHRSPDMTSLLKAEQSF